MSLQPKSNCAPNKVSGEMPNESCFSNFNVGISPSWVLTWIIARLVFQWFFDCFLLIGFFQVLGFLDSCIFFLFWDIKFFNDGNQYNLWPFFGKENLRVGWGVWCTVNRLIKNSQAVRSKVFYTSTLIWHIFWKCGVSLLGDRCKMFGQDNLTS